MTKFIIKYTTTVTKLGPSVQCWVVLNDEGYTTGRRLDSIQNTRPDGVPPDECVIFDSREAARAFISCWNGHPWFHVKDPYVTPEILEVVPRMVSVQQGWQEVEGPTEKTES